MGRAVTRRTYAFSKRGSNRPCVAFIRSSPNGDSEMRLAACTAVVAYNTCIGNKDGITMREGEG